MGRDSYTPPVREFRAQLELGRRAEVRNDFDLAAHHFFGADLARIVRTDEDMVAQREGVDLLWYLHGGEVRRADEKTQEKMWYGLLLELISNDKTGAPGWMRKALNIDYLLYLVVPARTAYFLEWKPLVRAFLENEETWIAQAMANEGMTCWKLGPDQFRTVKSFNPGYCSHSIAVPLKEFVRVGVPVHRIRLEECAPLHR